MILLSPFAKKMRNGKKHPKDYPHWETLISMIDEDIVQVGIEGEQQLVADFRKNLPLSDLKELVLQCRTWVSVDSFFQHFCWDLGKSGIVLFGQSDPKIFGHPENINLYADKKFFREKQFWMWEQAEVIDDAFLKPRVILDYINNIQE
tara:strand:+ start:175 stop:618 length:444 start_codon:yes stop_codon:yes gene_type:complete